jgi:FdhD protein
MPSSSAPSDPTTRNIEFGFLATVRDRAQIHPPPDAVYPKSPWKPRISALDATVAWAALRHHILSMDEFLLRPDPNDPRLTERLSGFDQDGKAVETAVVVERPLTLFLNKREIVTMMTICDYPEYLAVGYLVNQNMLRDDDEIIGIDYDADIETVVVRTRDETDFEDKLRKKTLTSGCAQGTAFGDLMERFDEVRLPADAVMHTSWLYGLTRKINTSPSLYLEAGAIHGCVLCEEDRPLLYMEDVGRHNAVDKIAGYMRLHAVSPAGKSFYTTGRLTSEMVIKTVQMGIPILASRSGFTAWGVDLARKAGLTLIGRAKGKRFIVLSGAERVIYDTDPGSVPEEPKRHRRKSSLDEDAA